jgi:hypothetical protein
MAGRLSHLPHQRKHVGIEFRIQQHLRINLLRLGVGGGLVEARPIGW